MSTVAAVALRTLAFGGLDAGIWGTAWGAEDPIVAVGALTPGAVLPAVAASFNGSSDAEDWSLSGDGVELMLSPESEPARASVLDGFDQLCRVRGHLHIDGARQEVDSLGRRASRTDVELSALESIRDVSAWFEPRDGVTLTALRPRGAGGHDRDLVLGSVFDSDGAVEVADPRLSTTYAADGLPARVGLELWLEDADGEQYPRRAAGESLGIGVHAEQAGLDLQAHAFRCHSRGKDGLGVYLLVRPR